MGGTHDHGPSESAKERMEFLEREMARIGKYIGNKTVADIGPGDGSVTKVLARRAKKVYAIDVDEKTLDVLAENCRNVKNVSPRLSESGRMPLGDKSVEVVFSSASFHHLPKGYLREMARVLKTKGNVIVLDWDRSRAPPFMRLAHRLFSEEEVADAFKAEGFTVLFMKTYKRHFMVVLAK